MVPMFYSQSWDTLVISNLVEDSALPSTMKLSASGQLSVQHQFIEDPSIPVTMKLTQGGDMYVKGGFLETYVAISSSVNPFDTWPYDDFESYTSGSDVPGLDGGWDWGGAWVAYSSPYSGSAMYDTMLEYNVSDAVSGSDGGIGWSGPMFAN